jgi:dipeptidase D
MLAVLDDNNLKHGPIEALFTVSEEITLVGALNLGKDMVEGKTLLNLDSEEDDTIYIGCAGAGVSNVKFKFIRNKLPQGFSGIRIKISGLKGGHSGLNIGEQRGNAIKILSRILANIKRDNEALISAIDGGTARNVIPSQAEAVIAIKNSKMAEIDKRIEKLIIALQKEYQTIDPNLKIDVENARVEETIDQETTDKIIRFGYLAPAGVITMSYDIKDFIQTSSNMAMLKVENNQAVFSFHSRSSVTSELEDVKMRIKTIADLVGGETEDLGGYPGWKPNLRSPVLNLAMGIYKELFGKEAKTKAIHAGLECGVIGETFGGMDMISIAATLENVHSVNERVNIKSVEKLYKFTTRIIADFK